MPDEKSENRLAVNSGFHAASGDTALLDDFSRSEGSKQGKWYVGAAVEMSEKRDSYPPNEYVNQRRIWGWLLVF